VVSYRGQVLSGAICDEHANAVARERLGLRDRARNLGTTKIGRALTDPSTKPRFQHIAEPEYHQITDDPGESSFSPFIANGFSARRRRSMSRSRRSGHRGRIAIHDDIDLDLVMIPDIADRAGVTFEPAEAPIPDITLLPRDHQGGEDVGLHNTSDGDPLEVKIVDAIEVLDSHAIPVETGEEKADQLLKEHGESIAPAALRAAIRERREIA